MKYYNSMHAAAAAAAAVVGGDFAVGSKHTLAGLRYWHVRQVPAAEGPHLDPYYYYAEMIRSTVRHDGEDAESY